MSYNKLILMENEEISDYDIMAKLDEAMQNQKDTIIFHNKEGTKIMVCVKRNNQTFECGILD